MKKAVMLILCLLLIGAASFAAEFTMSFGGGFEFFGDFTTSETMMAPSPLATIDTDSTITDLNYGGFLFFDATYAELFVSFYGGFNTLDSTTATTITLPPPPTTTTTDKSYKKTSPSMSIGLLGKYPFILNKFTLAPILGISYQIFFSGIYGNGYSTAPGIKLSPSDFNTLWAHAGIGVNYKITEKMYIKFEGLYGIKIMTTEYDKKNEDYVEKDNNGEVKNGWVNTVTARIGIGFNL